MDLSNYPPIFTHEFKVSTFETDRNSMLKPSAQLRQQQEAGERHLGAVGLDSLTMLRRGWAFIFTRAAAVIFRRPSLGETVRLKTWANGLDGVNFLRRYSFESESGERLIDSASAIALFDNESRRVLRPSVFFNEYNIPGYDNPPNACPAPEKIKLTKDMAFAGSRRLLYSDIDYNGHLNNAAYADFLGDFGGVTDFSAFTINFSGEAVLGDEIDIFTRRDGDICYLEGRHGRGKCFAAQADIIDN